MISIMYVQAIIVVVTGAEESALIGLELHALICLICYVMIGILMVQQLYIAITENFIEAHYLLLEQRNVAPLCLQS